MAKTATYTKIASYTTTGSPTTYTMSSIPSDYTDLILVSNFSFNAPNNFGMYVNGDTSSIYSTTNLGSAGSGATSGRQSGVSNWLLSYQIGSPTTSPGEMVLHFMDYSNTTTYKTVLARVDAAVATYPGVQVISGLYASTSAISSITFIGNSGSTINAGTTFTLYGIEAAK